MVLIILLLTGAMNCVLQWHGHSLSRCPDASSLNSMFMKQYI